MKYDCSAVSTTKIVLDKLRDLENTLLETQEETSLPTVSLEAVEEVTQFVEALPEEKKQEYRSNPDEIEFPEELNDRAVTEKVQKRLRQWRDQITNVLRARRQISKTGTVQQEIRFWRAKQQALDHIETELMQLPVVASTSLLKKNRMAVLVRGFENDLALTQTRREGSFLCFSNGSRVDTYFSLTISERSMRSPFLLSAPTTRRDDLHPGSQPNCHGYLRISHHNDEKQTCLSS